LSKSSWSALYKNCHLRREFFAILLALAHRGFEDQLLDGVGFGEAHTKMLLRSCATNIGNEAWFEDFRDTALREAEERQQYRAIKNFILRKIIFRRLLSNFTVICRVLF
jgi:hypothetical protein